MDRRESAEDVGLIDARHANVKRVGNGSPVLDRELLDGELAARHLGKLRWSCNRELHRLVPQCAIGRCIRDTRLEHQTAWIHGAGENPLPSERRHGLLDLGWGAAKLSADGRVQHLRLGPRPDEARAGLHVGEGLGFPCFEGVEGPLAFAIERDHARDVHQAGQRGGRWELHSLPSVFSAAHPSGTLRSLAT